MATKRSVGVEPDVNLRNPLSAREGTHSALKPRADVTRSPKQGISGPTKMKYPLKPAQYFTFTFSPYFCYHFNRKSVKEVVFGQSQN